MELKLKAEGRSEKGKGAARRMRERGEIPAVMYGGGSETISLSVKRDEFVEVISGEAGTNALINLVIGKSKESHLVMVKEVQRDPIKDRPLHLDFLKVARDVNVTTRVPIAMVGEEESVGLKAGGTLQHNLWEVEVECLPADLPDHLSVDIRDVKIGEHLTVGDLVPKKGVTILTEASDTILTILAPRVIVEEEVLGEEEAEAAAAEEAAEEAETGGEES